MLDCAIIGAGAAGLFCAYRLSQTDDRTALGVFERSARVGGRLYSVAAKGAGAPAELGAYSLSDQDENLYGLARSLELDLRPISFNARRHYLRGEHVGADPTDAVRTGIYRLQAREQGRHPHALLFEALQAACPELSGALEDAGNDAAQLRSVIERLRGAKVDNRLLTDWGFWNLLSKHLSNEAYELLLATHGAASAFRNANAYEAISLLLREAWAGQRHFRFTDGFSSLADALVRACEDRVSLATGHRLSSVGRATGGLVLNFETDCGLVRVGTKSLILALPKRALQAITFEDGLVGDQFYADLDAVSSVPASKLYLEFEKDWTSEIEGPFTNEEEVSASFTDLPMRQCYQFAPANVGEGGCLLLASFADDAAASYWSALAHGGHEDDFTAPPEMIGAACAQLAQIFPDAGIPRPTRGIFVDWSQARHGGAWHAWAPGVRGWDVRERMRRPNPSSPIFVCGEAFAQLQGWTEGAINNAEMMLERHFGVARPSWVRGDYAFEY